ncbi:hypothetical protein ACIA8K_37765 [Catenuloplanes sp. NPDC051500]|uniref:hypothetical protein n=1 Tax=Catenuloplanes sp. NPDC051500 TaxID=3363959 RepID=UPI0037911DCD
MRARPIVLFLAGLLIGTVLAGIVLGLTGSFGVTAGFAGVWLLVLGVVVRAQPAEPPVGPTVSYGPGEFLVVLRGYDIGQVRALLARIEAARTSTDPALRASVAAEARAAAFTVVMRGWDRGAVDAHLRAAAASLSS